MYFKGGGGAFRNSCSPDLSSTPAPTVSEYVNELLLRAIETMNRDMWFSLNKIWVKNYPTLGKRHKVCKRLLGCWKTLLT